MFQDDKMIPMLTAIVVMVAIGAVVQRMDGISDYITEPGPAVRLVDDQVPVAAGKLRRIDVFANDQNISSDHRIGLQIAQKPACGQVFIQDDIIQYLAEDDCAGRQTMLYTIEGIDPPVAGQVVAFVSSNNPVDRATPRQQDHPNQPIPADQLALAEDVPEVRAGTEPAEDQGGAPSLVDVLANGGADSAGAAQPATIPLVPEPQGPALTDSDIEQAPIADTIAADPNTSDVNDQAVIDLTNVQKRPVDSAEPLIQQSVQPQLTPVTTPTPAPDVQPVEETEVALVQPTETVQTPAQPELVQENKTPEPELTLAPVKHFQPAAPDGKLVSPRIGAFEQSSNGSPSIGPAPRISGPSDDGGATDFMVAVIPLEEPKTTAPAPLGVRSVIDGRTPNLAQPQADETSSDQDLQVAAVVPNADLGIGPALRDEPVDKDQPPLTQQNTLPAELHPIPKVRDAAALQAAQEAEQSVEQGETSPTSDDQTDQTQVAALPTATVACVTPPATTIDVGRAAQSTISIVAPCHANTVAELTYSGLRFAVPLDRDGEGSVTALGFEPNSAALLIFDNGEKVDFDLPFKGIARISRVALVWDMPINLELNALEFGANTGDEAHVWSGNPRSFKDVRKNGGGYLTAFRGNAGVGQNVQIYTHYSRNGAQSGIVQLMIDFASRNRDLLDGTCGTGQYAAPQFLIMRSEKGRKDRPVLRKLAPLACSDVPAEKGDKRLISGAVADLVISR
ncbi:MAG: hypothetical protein AAF557_20885 [Pseudomonadota bacterium]